MKRADLFNYLSPFSKLLILLMILFSTLIVTLVVGMLIGIPFFGNSMSALLESADIRDPQAIPLLKYYQILSQLGLFVFPSFLFAYFIGKKPASYLLIDKKPDLILLVLAGCLMVLSMPLTSWMQEMNQLMKLPAALQGLEDWMKTQEKDTEMITRAFLKSSTWSSFSVNFLMVAILPALGEELLFRSLLIRLFREWTRNIHWAVFISAVIFSAMHMQFYGFIPRLVLGLFLGYLFVWTGNLWIAVGAHLVNNGMAVIAAFLYERKLISVGLDDLGASPKTWEILVSTFLTALILLIVFQRQQRLRSVQD